MNKVVNRIGYYEFDSDEEPERDENNDIVIDSENQEPVIFDYVTMEDYQNIKKDKILHLLNIYNNKKN